MMILLLAKIAKLAWFDHPDIKTGLVLSLSEIVHFQSDEHKLIGLQALDQLLMEMTYMTKMKNLTVNRRISLSFRDAALTIIYKNNLEYTKLLIERFNNAFNQNSTQLTVAMESLEVVLETYIKCL
jgi:hypothetical protein